MKKRNFILCILIFLFVFTGTKDAFADTVNGEICDSNGNPLIYGKEYYVWHIGDTNIKRGGLTFEPHLSYDNLLFSNNSSAVGTAQVITGKPSGEIVHEGDTVKVKSTNGNWGNEREWASRNYFTGGIYNDMILKQSGDNLFIAGNNVDGKGQIGFGKYEADVYYGNIAVYSTNLIARTGKQNKLWLYMNRSQLLGNKIPTDPAGLNFVYRTTRKNLEFRPVN
ncbi:hypothetical protein JZO73_06875 [Enterococcus plantarum]|uniref:hypothetical protein n=1 Tax=Enterococcus plantarum TaxID=1077675 RepID=UPI001A8DE283|nr:hypothetical protein [Enterococcus plantarum]MBO0467257.1 hypothetical protein [Enterococcus plantarum]